MSRPAETGAARAALERLARDRGVATSYVDVAGERRLASDETLVAVLAALGEELAAPADAVRLAGEQARGGARRGPTGGGARVLVAWDGELPPLRLGRGEGADVPLEIRLEGAAGPERLVTASTGAGTLAPVGALPLGVHELSDAHGARRALVLAAPRTAPSLARAGEPSPWGLFAPTYALADRRGHPAGDLSSLGTLGALGAAHGARLVATLPLLAEWSSAEGGATGQHPYAPLSRMWWNEGYLDLARLPELASREGGALVARALEAGRPPATRRAADGRPLADVSTLAAAARPALEHAAGVLAATGDRRRAAFEAFAASRPDLERYARFRAAAEVAGTDLSRWPAAWRLGTPDVRELPAAALARHRYAQFASDTQLSEVAADLGARDCGLLLDLPIGCGAGGYDPWAFPEAFARGASVGAPPDDFFTGGQDWGFPPPRPETDRAAGYPLLRRVLARNAAHARVLRIDHVLAWSRLWWVPAGMEPGEGAYVRYPTEELVALACLEASRQRCALVGEDLGTVPRGLRPVLRRHGVSGIDVAVFDLEARPGRRLRPAPGTAAYVDTHDTATFAAFVTGADVALRERLGLGHLGAPAGSSRASTRARRARAVARLTGRLVRAGLLAASERDEPRAVLGAVLDELGASAAQLVVVAVDDLLGETEPQNVPGTTCEHDNFSRMLAMALEDLAADPTVTGLLGRLDAARRRATVAASDDEG